MQLRVVTLVSTMARVNGRQYLVSLRQMTRERSADTNWAALARIPIGTPANGLLTQTITKTDDCQDLTFAPQIDLPC